VTDSSASKVRIEGDGRGVVAHVGLYALGTFADRLDLGDRLSGQIPWTDERAPIHDRGNVLTRTMLMLAGGGQACTNIAALRSQSVLFGAVPSAPTLYRTVRNELSPSVVADLRTAFAWARSQVRDQSPATTGTDRVVLDIDASLVEIHSENKENTASTYKGGYGFHPMLCWTPRSANSPPPSLPDTTPMTIRPSRLVACWCAQIRRVAPTGSLRGAGLATSGSLSPHGATPVFRQRSAALSTTRTPGLKHSPSAVNHGWGLRRGRSPTSSI